MSTKSAIELSAPGSILRAGERLHARAASDLLHHSRAVPPFTHVLQDSVVQGPGSAANGFSLPGHPEGRAGVERLVQSASGLKLPVDVIHQLVAADVGETASLKHPGRGVGQGL